MKPRSVVFDLFGDHLRYLAGAVRTQSLVALLSAFDIGEPTARIVLARLRKEGWLETRRSGREAVWAVTPRALGMLDDGRARIFERARAPWDGQWRMVIYTVAEQDRAEREQLRRALAWLGFGPLAASTWLSPHDRLDDVEKALAEHTAVRADLLTCRSRGRAADLDMVSRCWDLDTLAGDYLEFVSSVDRLPSPTDLARLPGPESLRVGVRLVADYRRFPFRDPDLPADLLPRGWPGTHAHERFIAAHEALAGPARRFVSEVLERDG